MELEKYSIYRFLGELHVTNPPIRLMCLAGFGATCAANPLIWVDSAGWTGWEVLTVHDGWKMTLVTVLVKVERMNMAVVCQSADPEAHWK